MRSFCWLSFCEVSKFIKFTTVIRGIILFCSSSFLIILSVINFYESQDLLTGKISWGIYDFSSYLNKTLVWMEYNDNTMCPNVNSQDKVSYLTYPKDHISIAHFNNKDNKFEFSVKPCSFDK